MADPKKVIDNLNRNKETITLPKVVWMIIILLVIIGIAAVLTKC